MKFIHLRQGEHKGGLTVGYILDPQNHRAVMVLAQCSRHDRKKGRFICEKKWEGGRGSLIPVNPLAIIASIVKEAEAVCRAKQQ